MPGIRLSISRVLARAVLLASAISAANSKARASACPPGTTSLISPMRYASWAETSRPVSSSSRACFSPTQRSRNTITMAATKPSRTSV